MRWAQRGVPARRQRPWVSLPSGAAAAPRLFLPKQISRPPPSRSPRRGGRQPTARESPSPSPRGWLIVPQFTGSRGSGPGDGAPGSPRGGAGGEPPAGQRTRWLAALAPHAAATKGGGAAEPLRRRRAKGDPAVRRPRQLRREERGRSGERAGRAQRHAEKGQRRRLLPSSARLITRSPLAADLQEQINQRARLDEICCYCAHF